MKMTVHNITGRLVKENVDTVFGILGGAVLPLYDTLPQFLKSIMYWCGTSSARHMPRKVMRAPQARLECVLRLPAGATNLVTGIANAYLDSTADGGDYGQVARRFIGKDAFQEVDITGITLPIPSIIIWYATRLRWQKQ